MDTREPMDCGSLTGSFIIITIIIIIIIIIIITINFSNHVITKFHDCKEVVMNFGKNTWCPKKLYPILRLNLGAVHYSMAKVSVLPDSKICTNHLVPKMVVFMP